MVSMFQHYLKVALRNLSKYKQQSLASVIGLAIGITCFAFCSYTLRVFLNWDSSIKEVDRICILYSETEKGVELHDSRYASAALAKDFPEIESSIAYSENPFFTNRLCEVNPVNGTPAYFNEKFLFADPAFLDFFSIRLLSGNKKEIEQTPGAILVTEKTAYKLYGSLDVIGKSFSTTDDFMGTKDNFIIRGVIENFPKQSSLEEYSGIELNTTNRKISEPTSSAHYNSYRSYVKVKPGIDLTRLNEKLKNHTLKYLLYKDYITEKNVQLQPLTKRHELFNNQEARNTRFFFSTIGLLVLLTALFNYVIFIIGRMMNRIRECGIRQVNGADKRSLFYLLFTEASIAFMAACFFSFIFAELILPYISTINQYFIPDRSYIFELIIQYSLIGIACIALLSLIVIHRIGKVSVIQSLFSEQSIRRHSILRNLFISVQLVICFLFIGATWFVKQQSNLIEYRLTNGLSETEQTSLFNIHLTGSKLNEGRSEILQKLRQDPQIETICRSGMGFSGAWDLGKGYFSWDGISDKEAASQLGYINTDPEYFSLFKQQPIQGRFYKEDETDKIVVNEAFARLVNRNPVGMQVHIRLGENNMPGFLVVGVVPDFTSSWDEIKTRPNLPCIYMPYPEDSPNLYCLVKVKPEYRTKFPEVIKAEINKYLSQGTPVRIPNLKEEASYNFKEEDNIFKLTSAFSIICVLISLLGIYASVTLSTDRRKKEVAIRKINGATPGSILSMFARSSLIQVTVAAMIAFPLLGGLLTIWLNNYLDRISITLFPFVVLFLLMVVIVGLTIVWQLRKIARINPAEMVKSE